MCAALCVYVAVDDFIIMSWFGYIIKNEIIEFSVLICYFCEYSDRDLLSFCEGTPSITLVTWT